MKRQNGITIIALIITIIILLILASITIITLNGDNGLFKKSKQAKEETNKEQVIEELKLKVMDVQTQKEGNATLKDFVEYLENDKEGTYTISLTKTASIDGDIPDLTNVKEIYVTYKNIECKVDEFLRVEYSTTIISNRGDNNPTLKGCSRYIEVQAKSSLGKITLSVDIPEADKIEKIQYYVDDKKVYEGTEKQYVVDGLEIDKEYSVYAIVTYTNEKIIKKVTNIGWPSADVYVSKFGDDTSGDGTIQKPYASIDKAIESATDGQKIYIDSGTYILNCMNSSSDGQVGIYDKGKQLEIFGNNEETILEFDANTTTVRDGGAMGLSNEKTVVRNLVYIYKPKTGSNYNKSIFRYCKGKVSNVFFRISGNNKASYLYYNNQSTKNNVVNCTFYHDKQAVDSNYSGTCNFNNIATNVKTNGTNTNVIVKEFGLEQDSLQELIQKSKADSDFIQNQVGVFYGENAW